MADLYALAHVSRTKMFTWKGELDQTVHLSDTNMPAWSACACSCFAAAISKRWVCLIITVESTVQPLSNVYKRQQHGK